MVIKDCVYCEDLIDDRFMGNLLNVLNVDFLLNGEDILLFRDDMFFLFGRKLVFGIFSRFFMGLLFIRFL